MKQLQEYANGVGRQGIARVQSYKGETADELRQQMGERQHGIVKDKIDNEFKNKGSLTWKLQRLEQLRAKTGAGNQ